MHSDPSDALVTDDTSQLGRSLRARNAFRRCVILTVSCAAASIGIAAFAGAQTIRQDLYVANGPVRAQVISGNTLYIGGDFTSVGPSTSSGIPIDKVTGAAVSGFPKVNGRVNAVAPDGSGGWYIGGEFTAVGGFARSHIARILADNSVSTWNPNANQNVDVLAVSGATVYATGTFTTIGGQTRHYAAALDATTGLALAWNPNVAGGIYALAVSGPTVYVGGEFTSIGGQSRANIAAVDATTGLATDWNPSSSGVIHTGLVRSLAIGSGVIYAGGYFTSIGGQPRNYIAALDVTTGLATTWNPNANGGIYALVVSGGTVYAAGGFGIIGGKQRTSIAALDATTGLATAWNPSPGVNANTVFALAVSGGTVYAGGDFTYIGGQFRGHVAALDASTGLATSWDPSLDSSVYALAMSGAAVFAGGRFTSMGALTRHHLAAIDLTTGQPTNWSPDVVDFAYVSVYSLALSGSTLYVGGLFGTIGGQTRNNVAAVDAVTGAVTSWNPNANSVVRTLAASAGTVYAGGSFTSIGGQTRNFVAALDANSGLATTWNPNPSNLVYSVAASGGVVYAAGLFSNIGGQVRSYIAALDASTGLATAWNPSPNYTVNALVVDCGTVYVGGAFGSIGGRSYPDIAALDVTSGLAKAWYPTGLVRNVVDSITLSGGSVYFGGWSVVASADAVTGQSAGWSPVPVSGQVVSLAVNGATVYAGGLATIVGGEQHAYLAGITSSGPYVIHASAGSSGSISPNGNVSVAGDADQLFTITANPTFSVADVQVDGCSVGAVTSYQFQSVHEVHSISATFTGGEVLSVTVSPPGAGSVVLSPPGGVYTKGTVVQLTATANAGKLFATWSGTGTGSYSGANNPATVTMNGQVSETVYFQSTTGTNLHYVGADGGVWNNPANWTGGAGAPANGDRGLVTPSTSKSVTLDTDYAVPGLIQLYLDGSSGATATLNQSAHAMFGTIESIGVQGSGVYHQTGGSNATTGDMHIGQDGGGTGTYVLDGGSLDAGSSEYVGEGSSTGNLTQNGGTHTVYDAMKVAYTPGSHGHVTLTNGSLAVTNPNGSGYLQIGYRGTGTFDQSGGSVDALHLQMADGLGGNATYTLGSGTLNVFGSEAIGTAGVGQFTQNGGTHTMTGNMYLTLVPGSPNAGSSGRYDLNGGTLNVAGNIYNYGTFTQASGATLNLGGTIIGNGVIQSQGSMALGNQSNINTGSIQAGGDASGQTLTVGLDATDPNTNAALPGNGTLDITGGTTTLNGTLGVGNDGSLATGTGNGHVNVSGGTLNAGTIILGSATGGSGDMTISSPGQVVVGGGLTNNDLTMDGGSLEVLDQNPPADEDSVLNRSIVGGYLRDGTMTMNGGYASAPNVKLGVTPGKVGTLTMNAGTLVAGNLLAAQGAGSVIQFNGGTLVSGHSEVDGSGPLGIGNGVSVARLLLAPSGGTHTFADGLAVTPNATLSGGGTIVGDVTNAGTVNPGNDPGDVSLLTEQGAFAQGAGGTLRMDLGAGGAGTGYDAIHVSGPAAVGGTLAVAVVGENPPAIGQHLEILTGHPVSGTFASVTGPGGGIVYTDTSVVLIFTGTDVSPTPPGDSPVLELALRPLHPNPSRGASNIAFELPSAGGVSLAIHDVSGRLVRTLVSGTIKAGRHNASWDGRSDSGVAARPGVYWVRLNAAGRSLTRKLVVL